jgi:hypothetical protein
MQRRNSRTIDNLFQHDYMINDQMMPGSPSTLPVIQTTPCLHPHSNEDAYMFLFLTNRLRLRLCEASPDSVIMFVCMSYLTMGELSWNSRKIGWVKITYNVQYYFYIIP